MYLLDQPRFLNCVIKVSCNISADLLLQECKSIEAAIGRNFGEIRNGPRVIDLDILFYGNVVYDSTNLNIPHIGVAERLFVLKPMAEYFLFK